MALSSLLLPIDISNLRNSKLKVIDLVGLYSTNEGSFIKFHVQFVDKLPNECGWIGDKISNNSPTIHELVLSSLGDMFCASVVSIVVHATDTSNYSLAGFNHSYPITKPNGLAFFHFLKKCIGSSGFVEQLSNSFPLSSSCIS